MKNEKNEKKKYIYIYIYMLVTAFLQDFVDWIQLFECVFKCITELSFEFFNCDYIFDI